MRLLTTPMRAATLALVMLLLTACGEDEPGEEPLEPGADIPLRPEQQDQEL